MLATRASSGSAVGDLRRRRGRAPPPLPDGWRSTCPRLGRGLPVRRARAAPPPTPGSPATRSTCGLRACRRRAGAGGSCAPSRTVRSPLSPPPLGHAVGARCRHHRRGRRRSGAGRRRRHRTRRPPPAPGGAGGHRRWRRRPWAGSRAGGVRRFSVAFDDGGGRRHAERGPGGRVRGARPRPPWPAGAVRARPPDTDITIHLPPRPRSRRTSPWRFSNDTPGGSLPRALGQPGSKSPRPIWSRTVTTGGLVEGAALPVGAVRRRGCGR